MDEFGDLSALIDDEPNPRDLVALLRKREALGELMAAGGPALSPQAQATLGGARQRLGDAAQTRNTILKRALWQQQRAPTAPPTEQMIAEAERMGIDRQTASLLSGPQLQNVLGASAQRKAALADKERLAQTPEAQRSRELAEEAAALERESKRSVIEQRREESAARPAKDEADLRREWIGQAPYKNAQAAIEQFAKVENSSADAAGDLSLIFSYMKMLDPGSAVREGEFANAQNAAGIPDRIKAAWNKALAGERLSPEARERFRKEAEGVLRSTLDAYEQNAEFYRGIAKDRGFDPNRVVPPMKRLKGKAPASAGGRIRVRVKETGLTGTMPAENFDPAKYERID